MKRNDFSPLEDGASSGTIQVPAMEGALVAAAAVSTWRTALKPYWAAVSRFWAATVPSSLPSFRVALMVVR